MQKLLREDAILKMVDVCRKDMPKTGTVKLLKHLQESWSNQGIDVGRDSLNTILRSHNLLVRKRARSIPKTTNSFHSFRRYPDLVNENKNNFIMNERINSVLDQTGLNWTVREECITTESGIIIPDKKAIIRDDTNTVLSVHGDGYFPYQNHQLVDLLDKVSTKIGLPIHKGGSFGDGKKVYLQFYSLMINLCVLSITSLSAITESYR